MITQETNPVIISLYFTPGALDSFLYQSSFWHFFAIKSRFFTEKEQKKVRNLLSKLFLSVCFRLAFYLHEILCFYPQQGKGQVLALSWALALGREGRREALVTSTLPIPYPIVLLMSAMHCFFWVRVSIYLEIFCFTFHMQGYLPWESYNLQFLHENTFYSWFQDIKWAKRYRYAKNNCNGVDTSHRINNRKYRWMPCPFKGQIPFTVILQNIKFWFSHFCKDP